MFGQRVGVVFSETNSHGHQVQKFLPCIVERVVGAKVIARHPVTGRMHEIEWTATAFGMCYVAKCFAFVFCGFEVLTALQLCACATTKNCRAHQQRVQCNDATRR